MAEILHLKNRHDVIFFCRGWSDFDKISETGAELHVDCGDVVEIKTRSIIPIWQTFGQIQWHVIPEPLPHCRVLPPGEFNGMSSKSHVSHCSMLPLGEFTVMIPEPYATLQGAVTWQNQCHDHATLQRVRILSTILKIVFRHIFFVFNAVWVWRAATFVSSLIHLLFTTFITFYLQLTRFVVFPQVISSSVHFLSAVTYHSSVTCHSLLSTSQLAPQHLLKIHSTTFALCNLIIRSILYPLHLPALSGLSWSFLFQPLLNLLTVSILTKFFIFSHNFSDNNTFTASFKCVSHCICFMFKFTTILIFAVTELSLVQL